MEIESKDEVHGLSPFNFWCHNKGNETLRYGMFRRWISWSTIAYYDTIASWDKRYQKWRISWETLSAKNLKKDVYVSGLTVRNDKYDGKGKEIKAILKKKINDKNLSFTDNGNINPRMLNKSGLHLNEYGTTQLVNDFFYYMKKWRDKICMDNDSRRKKIT